MPNRWGKQNIREEKIQSVPSASAMTLLSRCLPIRTVFSTSISLLLLGCGLLATSAYAQLSASITAPDGSSTQVTGRDANRENEALILYTKAYGKETRTNAFGTEVILAPVNTGSASTGTNSASPTSSTKQYRVTQITRAAECMQNHTTCGNAQIPEEGLVLSATGGRRDWLNRLQIGDTLSINEDWAQIQQANLSVINPNPQNNPMGSGFPGFRASNQIVKYDAAYGRPNTGTNEFGFEVTVRNGIVMVQEGSDSSIPQDDGYVLSGHGKGRSWLIANTPPGAHVEISPDGKTVISRIDFDTYMFQFNQRWAESPCSASLWSSRPSTADPICGQLQAAKDKAIRLNLDNQPGLAIALLNQTLEGVNRRIWLSYAPFPGNTIRGAWHRPVEKTATDVGKTLDTLKAAGLNAVFLETYFHGYTIFPSQTFAAYGLPTENPKFEGVDLLQLWLDEAHKRDMQVHVWFQAFYAGTKAYLPPGPVLSKYPNWANVQFSALKHIPDPTALPATASTSHTVNPNQLARPRSAIVTNPAMPLSNNTIAGVAVPIAPTYIYKAPDKPVPSTLELGAYFLDPTNPQVQDFVLKLGMEIVNRYPIDGFQLDYIRYPASFPSNRFSFRKTTWGYTDIARNAFKAQYGIDPVDIDPKVPSMAGLWLDWGRFKTQQVSSFVEKITTEIHRKKPKLAISAAIFPDAEAALALKHQDWITWGQKGWINFYAPMTLTSALKVVEHDTQRMVSSTNNKIPVYSGIFGPFNGNSADLMLSQINTARNAGSKGFVLFDTAHLTGRMLDALNVMQTHPKQIETLLPASEQLLSPSEADASTEKLDRKRRWWKR